MSFITFKIKQLISDLQQINVLIMLIKVSNHKQGDSINRKSINDSAI